MGLFDEYQTTAKESAGVAVMPAGPNTDGTMPEFILAFKDRSNANYAKSLERHSRPYRRLIELETLDPMISEELMMRVFVESILLGRNNVQDKDGKPLSFNAENAMTLLKALPHLYHRLDEQSQKASLFREEIREADAKN